MGEPAEAVEGERPRGGGGGAEEEGERQREDERDGDEGGEERAGQAPREPRHGRRERCSGDAARSPRRRRTMRRARGWIRRAREPGGVARDARGGLTLGFSDATMPERCESSWAVLECCPLPGLWRGPRWKLSLGRPGLTRTKKKCC
jgi:hypothetical protein